jgi:hypothetical protein
MGLKHFCERVIYLFYSTYAQHSANKCKKTLHHQIQGVRRDLNLALRTETLTYHAHIFRVGQKRIYTPYMTVCMYGDFSAKNYRTYAVYI